MTGNPILYPFHQFCTAFSLLRGKKRPNLHVHWLQRKFPSWVRGCTCTMRLLDLLGPLDWSHFPERNLQRNWGQPTISYAAFAAACLVKLNEGLVSMGGLRQFLYEHPAFIWLLGFPLSPSSQHPHGFDPDASLPTPRHLTQMLRKIPNAFLQFLLEDSVRLILQELTRQKIPLDDVIALDTKHILAWVKENNPKEFLQTRFDKTQQPKGDPDCKLGCKRRHNRQVATPVKNPHPASVVQAGEFYWGYASGVAAVKIPGWGEFVLAEMTQPFDRPDVSYFFPLMAVVEQRLGKKPRFGALDAAFDAFYVYDYFHQAGGFAAVPFSEKGGYKAQERQFSQDGLPICAAGFPMPLKFTYTDRTVTIVEHERGKYVCPLFFPQPTGHPCPINHKHWRNMGCTAMMPTSSGSRIRYTLDRKSQEYRQVYNQRTAVERIFSQAVDLGIERPHLRSGAAIANQNTLIYILINLRTLQRIRER